jgi:DNA-binding NtrC family response regulator
MGDIDGAIAEFKNALQHNPGDLTAVRNLNSIYERQGYFARLGSPEAGQVWLDVRESASPIFNAQSEHGEVDGEDAIVGRSAGALRMARLARLAAASDSPVLLEGEAGSGKELVARVIHAHSPRGHRPFATVHCGGAPAHFVESEIFGHERGAFTGANAARAGRLEDCAGGVLFLSGVHELPAIIQLRLIQYMESGEFRRAGGGAPIRSDVRILASTEVPLADRVRDRTFRADLHARLDVISIRVPALRERPEDIPLLIDHFEHRYRRQHPNTPRSLNLTPDDLRVLGDYPWPGNVRELRNFVERALVLGADPSRLNEEISRLRRERAKRTATEGTATYPPNLSLEEVERRHIRAVLDATRGNQRAAARILGINPSTLWRKMKGQDGE